VRLEQTSQPSLNLASPLVIQDMLWIRVHRSRGASAPPSEIVPIHIAVSLFTLEQSRCKLQRSSGTPTLSLEMPMAAAGNFDQLAPVQRVRVCKRPGTVFRAAAAALILLSVTIEIQPQTSPELETGKPVQGLVAGGRPDYHSVSLDGGQYLRVEVTPQDVDVVARMFAPDGKLITEAESPYGLQEPVPVHVVAENPGIYRLAVAPTAKGLPPHAYRVEIEELRPATAQDTLRMRAQEALTQGQRLQKKGSKTDLRSAIGKFKQALSFSRAAGDRAEEAWGLNALGDVYSLLSEDVEAEPYLKQALEIRRAVADRRGQGQTLNDLGAVYDDLSEKQKALDFYGQALTFRRAIGDRRGEQESLNNIGIIYDNLGEHRKALDLYKQALAISQAISDREDEAATLHNIGKVQDDLGDEQEALSSYTTALALRRAVGDRQGEAITLNNMGLVFDAIDEKQKALQYFTQALKLRRLVGDWRGEAYTLRNIGNTYLSLGETQQALDYLNRSLAILRSVRDRLGEADALNMIGLLYYSIDDKRQALRWFNRALLVNRSVDNRHKEAAIVTNIGQVYSDLGRKESALEYYDRALSIEQSVEDKRGEAVTLNKIGNVCEKLGDRQKALDSYKQALTLTRTVGDRRTEASILYGIAHVEQGAGDLTEARAQIDESLAILDSLRTSVLSPGLRASYSGTLQKPYEFYVDLLMQLDRLNSSSNYAAKALEVNEQRLARTLLETLAESRADIHQGIPSALRDRERSLRQALDAKSDRLMQLLNGKHTEDEATTSRKEVDELFTQYQEVEGEIRESRPRYAALTQAQTLSVQQIERLLDPDALLLEYSLGEERSYLWVLSQNSVTSFQLANRGAIEAAVRSLYGRLPVRNRLMGEVGPRPAARPLAVDAEYARAAAELSDIVLGPAVSKLGTKRLVIVSDGALQYVPFSALPIKSRGQERISLVVDHEIVSLPSASVLGMLREEKQERASRDKLLVVLADPVFSAQDPRLAKLGQASNRATHDKPNQSAWSADPQLVRTMRSVGATTTTASLPRLWFSRQEAEGVFSLVPPGEGREYLDFDASLGAATSSELSHYQILHFATHGILDTQYPELSGLVLSLVDRKGKPQRGFLSLEQIYNLNLPTAQLVVLSACDTALGREIKGEGLVGMTRGFMYAGANRVVSSLWEVNDVATAELMEHFYRGMLQEGLSPSAALRAAQLAMYRQPRWSSPYYWAGFIITGDWKGLNN
jgi:CHAT domain-containing protein/Tfp pilus assembly protein PilF